MQNKFNLWNFPFMNCVVSCIVLNAHHLYWSHLNEQPG